jgi:inosine-uridine nucleoside N-ribohydrolase
MPTTPIIIDCDPGIDDVVALALAARSPELQIRAVITSYGNAELEKTTRNAITLMRLVGHQDIPVIPGSDRPLARPLVTAPETHGVSGVGYAEVETASPVTPNPAALLDTLADQSDPVVLVTLGPLTNLAHALDRDSALVSNRTLRHIGMFGNIEERGNTNRWADFNAWSDPEAVATVLASPLETEMVGLDVTRRMTLDAAQVEAFATSGVPDVAWLGLALRFYVEFHRRQERLDGCVVNDPLPIGELIRPGILGFESLNLAVDLDETEHRGHTVERPNGYPTAVALDVAIPEMQTLLTRVFGDRFGRPSPGEPND